MFASYHGNERIVELLFKYDVKLDLKNREEKTALDLAANNVGIQKIILDEKGRREKIIAEISSFLKKEQAVLPEVTGIIFEMKGTKPSK